MFNNVSTIEELHEKYGGQRYHGIITPANFPHIFLIHSEEKYDDNLDLDNNGGERVRFAYEGNGELRYGNAAVVDHKTRNDVYNSLFLFDLQNKKLKFLGEYEYDTTEEIENIRYFILKKVKYNYDEVNVFYVNKVINSNSVLASSIGNFDGYYMTELEQNIDPVVIDIDTSELSEGKYIDDNNQVIDQNVSVANASPEAKKANQHDFILDKRNRILRKISKKYKVNPFKDNVKNAYIYCVNTGCGKTCFMVVVCNSNNYLWCFDWGRESIAKRSEIIEYQSNINDCLELIKKKFFTNRDFNISKLFISHPHFDHISEINDSYLSECEVWMNLWIHSGTKQYYNLLNKIISKGCKIVEPLKNNSTSDIMVLHPDKRIKCGYPRSRSKRWYNTSSYNNVSPLIQINVIGKKILFTGDIEHQGWGWFNNTFSAKQDEDIYVHSHHGSGTGFVVDKKHNKNIYDLFSIKNMQLMFTRDQAYTGIVDNNIAALNPVTAGKIWRTDDPGVKIIEVDVGAGTAVII